MAQEASQAPLAGWLWKLGAKGLVKTSKWLSVLNPRRRKCNPGSTWPQSPFLAHVSVKARTPGTIGEGTDELLLGNVSTADALGVLEGLRKWS